jgi:hypothetical protein
MAGPPGSPRYHSAIPAATGKTAQRDGGSMSAVYDDGAGIRPRWHIVAISVTGHRPCVEMMGKHRVVAVQASLVSASPRRSSLSTITPVARSFVGRRRAILSGAYQNRGEAYRQLRWPRRRGTRVATEDPMRRVDLRPMIRRRRPCGSATVHVLVQGRRVARWWGPRRLSSPATR